MNKVQLLRKQQYQVVRNLAQEEFARRIRATEGRNLTLGRVAYLATQVAKVYGLNPVGVIDISVLLQ